VWGVNKKDIHPKKPIENSVGFFYEMILHIMND
jgi:hypothetical protein